MAGANSRLAPVPASDSRPDSHSPDPPQRTRQRRTRPQPPPLPPPHAASREPDAGAVQSGPLRPRARPPSVARSSYIPSPRDPGAARSHSIIEVWPHGAAWTARASWAVGDYAVIQPGPLAGRISKTDGAIRATQGVAIVSCRRWIKTRGCRPTIFLSTASDQGFSRPRHRSRKTWTAPLRRPT